MAIKIEKTITGYRVANVKSDNSVTDMPLFSGEEKSERSSAHGAEHDEKSNVIQMHEQIVRPEMLSGSTYKIKTPLSEHALYVTINDMTLNAGTPYERQRPYEIFLNSKNMEHYQWTVALTRIISAVFRKGGDNTFLVDELKAVFDPGGGYIKRGGGFVPSLVAEIGSVIETHMTRIGMIAKEPMSEVASSHLQEKRQEYERRNNVSAEDSDSDFPPGCELCISCQTVAAIYMDGCLTCLNCGDSKCS